MLVKTCTQMHVERMIDSAEALTHPTTFRQSVSTTPGSSLQVSQTLIVVSPLRNAQNYQSVMGKVFTLTGAQMVLHSTVYHGQAHEQDALLFFLIMTSSVTFLL